jgi:hypothetical protein
MTTKTKRPMDVKSKCEPASRHQEAMSGCRDQEGEPANEAPELRMCKREDVTNLTLVCADTESLVHYMDTVGARDQDFFSGLLRAAPENQVSGITAQFNAASSAKADTA